MGSGAAGNDDGVGTAASIHWPTGMDWSPDGSTVLVSAFAKNTVRKIDVATGTVTTLAGDPSFSWPADPGHADGTGTAALLSAPSGISFSPDGSTALVADMDNHCIREITVATGAVTTIAGQPGTYGWEDGTGSGALFGDPMGVAHSPDGKHALITSGWTTIRKLDLATRVVTTIAGEIDEWASTDGTGLDARFCDAIGIAYSPDGSFALVANACWNDGKVRRIDMATLAVTTIVPVGTVPYPYNLAIAPDGASALVGGAYSWQYQYLYHIDLATNAITAMAGGPGGNADGDSATARFAFVSGIAYSPDGRSVMLSDYTNNRVKRVDIVCDQPSDVTGYTTIVETELKAVAGFDVTAQCDSGYAGTAVASECGSGGVYALSGCSDTCTQPSDITGYAVTETDLTVAGFDVSVQCAAGWSGTPAVSVCNTAIDYTLSGCTDDDIVCTQPSDITGYTVFETELSATTGFAVTAQCAAGWSGTAAATACTADGDYTLSGCVELGAVAVTTLAGTGTTGSNNGVGAAATFNSPIKIAWSPDGTTIVISEEDNHLVRKLEVASNTVTTIMVPLLNSPQGLAYSPDGTHVLLCDRGNSVIQKIDMATNQVTTIVGDPGTPGDADGVGTVARLQNPTSIVYSPDGTHALVTAGTVLPDAAGARETIRKITFDPNGNPPTVTTIAGQSGVAAIADGTGTDATFKRPGGMAYSPDGAFVLIGEYDDNQLRKMDMTTLAVTTVPGSFMYPWDITISPDGSVALIGGDWATNQIAQLDLSTWQSTPWAGNGGGYVDGGSAVAKFQEPAALSFSPDGHSVAVAEYYNRIRRIDIICKQPSDITGYTVTETELSPLTGFDVSAQCDAGYEGTATANVCESKGYYFLSGCAEIVCTQPSDTTGYMVVETELNVVTGFDVSVQCAAGWSGSPTVSACTSAGDYTLSGCTDANIVCTQPSDITGYTVTETELSVAVGFAVTPQCAAGYEGTPAVSACTSAGNYTLSGCTEIVCTQPDDASGYASIVNTQLSVPAGFDVSAECSTLFSGTASATACTSSGPYTLQGCTFNTSTAALAPAFVGSMGLIFFVLRRTCNNKSRPGKYGENETLP